MNATQMLLINSFVVEGLFTMFTKKSFLFLMFCFDMNFQYRVGIGFKTTQMAARVFFLRMDRSYMSLKAHF